MSIYVSKLSFKLWIILLLLLLLLLLFIYLFIYFLLFIVFRGRFPYLKLISYILLSYSVFAISMLILRD